MEYSELRDVFKFKVISKTRFNGNFDMPIIHGTNKIPSEIIAFNEINTCKSLKDKFVHFYIDDYQFERIWTHTNKYIGKLKACAGVIMPDFSMYSNMPKPIQIYNCFRSKLLATYFQSLKIEVIPNVIWSNEDSFNYCFDGLPKYSVVSISTNGCLNKESKELFLKGFNELILRLKPIKILVYGSIPEELKNNDKVVKLNSRLERLQNLKKGDKI